MLSRAPARRNREADVLRVLKVIAVAVLVTICLIMQLQVFQRYVVGRSLDWPDELAAALMAILTFVGGALATKYGDNICVTVLLDRMSEKWRLVVETLADIIALLFIGVLGYYSVPLILRTWEQTLVTLPVSRGLVYLVIWFSIAAMFYYAVMRSAIARHLRSRCPAQDASQTAKEDGR